VPGSPEEITFFHPAGYLQTPAGQLFGKDVANVGLFSALARHGGYSRINVLHQSSAGAAELAGQYFLPGAPQGVLATGPAWNTELPARSGLLLRGAASLGELTWLRRTASVDSAYSLVGLIHTIAPPFIRSQIAAAALAPVQPWDAVICTSPSVQQAMQAMFEAQEAWLAERCGATRQPRPQLPLIPLGVDVAALANHRADVAARASLRERLGLQQSDVMVLWVGRLSYFEKAFPQAMLQAVQQAAARTSRRLVLALAGWFPNGEADQQLYVQAAQQLAPGLQVHILNGGNRELLAQAWAAADVFLSLVDNIQETFGLAPVEAMAAGLPVVVSDWDGYRYTVRDGVDGFLIPTLGSPGGSPGELLAHVHSLELETYQNYVGAVAQHTAVHVGRAADALVRLVDSPELCRRLGEAGQQRARELFDWPVVVSQYNALFAELAERRAQAITASASEVLTRIQPSRGDPFADFRGFATTVLDPALRLRLAAGCSASDLQALLAVKLNQLYPGLRGSTAEAMALLEQLEASGAPGLAVADLLSSVDSQRRPYLETTLVWLAKLGLVDWLSAVDP
jgi:glycosyltransferase involved in cell wall biosynthesis